MDIFDFHCEKNQKAHCFLKVSHDSFESHNKSSDYNFESFSNEFVNNESFGFCVDNNIKVFNDNVTFSNENNIDKLRRSLSAKNGSIYNEIEKISPDTNMFNTHLNDVECFTTIHSDLHNKYCTDLRFSNEGAENILSKINMNFGN